MSASLSAAICDVPADTLPGQPLPSALPPLRENLRLHAAPPNQDGSPAWMIQDPISNVFFRIGWLEFELLVRWSAGTGQALVDAVRRETPLQPTQAEVGALYAFLLQNQLLDIHDARHSAALVARQRQQATQRLRWLVHNYLFFRIPLVRPDQTLRRLLPWLGWLHTRTTAVLVATLTLIGLVLTFRQLDVFVASFLETVSPGGIAGYLIAIAVAKSLHELGHALTATRYGVRVSHMGVAFIVLWPLLYTDTGEAWRLPSRRQRLLIDSAGILTELAIAGLATLGWHLAGDGDLKQALFYLATTSWVMTLALNASPFMRFDGYFILCDALEMPNLHERAFAVARTALRNTLFGWHDPDPEPLSAGRRRALIAFAFMVWLYRLMLFVAIAVAVYLFFFKLLGIVLFVVEIVWFILLPIGRELKVWRARRAEVPVSRRVLLGALILGPLALLALPWSWPVRGEAWAHPAHVQVLYSPIPAQLIRLPENGATVSAGTPLFALQQPELAYRAEVAMAQGDALDVQLRSLSGMADGEARRATMAQLRAVRASEQAAFDAERQRLQLAAPFDGRVTDLDPLLAPGVWVTPQDPLAVLIAPGHWLLEVFIPQADVAHVTPGATVRFYPSGDPLTVLTGQVTEIDAGRTTHLPHELLSTRHGGRIPVLPAGGADGRVPRDTLYRVRARLDRPPDALRMQTGRALIDGAPRSRLLEGLKPALVVLIREAGF